ncbi:hypothetical protein [Chlorobium sp. KB01]|uniref:hypothetical protein n=1 Tax=Chlorobium sp. KB01 TaxID=1917528 RepID=UPI00097632BC|nr:hypothetical protein [Chlorobium sp. KB01]
MLHETDSHFYQLLTAKKMPVEMLVQTPVEKTVKTSERILGLLWGQSGKVAQAWPLGGVAMSIIGNAERKTQNSVTSCDGERLNEYILT